MILEVERIGDATSVPFLIEALRRQGTVPREGPYVVDTQHCLDALQVLTNHDAGRHAEDWRSWYEANKSKTQEQWILQGFAQHGFPVSSPAGDPFVTALIHALHPKYQPRHIRKNAMRLLAAVSPTAVLRMAGPLSDSAEASSRRAALAAVEQITGDERVGLLRMLTRDVDVDVAENALRVLNDALRDALPPSHSETIWDFPFTTGDIRILHVLDRRVAVLATYGVDQRHVVGFDLVAHTVRWRYATRDTIGSGAVRVGDHLYFMSDDRIVHSISVHGKKKWAKPLAASPDVGTSAPPITAVGDRLFIADGQTIYVITLSGNIEAFPIGDHVSRIVVQGRDKVFGAVQNGPLLVVDGSGRPKRVSTGLNTAALSAGGDVMCVVSFGPRYALQCLEQDTLRELWRVELPGELGGYHELQQDAANVYVLAQGRTLAFDLRTGTRRWASNEFAGFGFFRVVGGMALTRGVESELEWRDLKSGEVIATPGRRGTRYAPNAVVLGETVLAETRDTSNGRSGLRLSQLPAVVRQRLSAMR